MLNRLEMFCNFSFLSFGAEEKLQYRNILSIRIQYSITKMLLLISTVFIMLNLPRFVIFRIVDIVKMQSLMNDKVSSSLVIHATAT